jgi:Fe-S oxidoreductase
LNVKSIDGIESLRAIAKEVSDLVGEFSGAMSGEHGDGLARSRWNEKLFGPELAEAFRAIKHAFDPDDRMNPGKVTASPDVADDLRLSPSYHAEEPSTTVLDFSGQGGFARSVEMCSGVGVCRKPTGGTMCPSYMITRDEMHSTRGRSNALRLVMSGALPADGLRNDTLQEALDLCLQCKACKTECPSNVDMAKLKAEVLYQNSRSKPLPIGNLLMGHIHKFNAIGSATAPLANWTARQPVFRRLLQTFAGIDQRRIMPEFAPESFRRWFRRRVPAIGSRGEVILLDDCFTTYNAPSVSRASVAVIEAAGYRVRLAGLACCGRPAASKGMLDEARALARTNVEILVKDARQGTPILGLEPGCLTMLMDEYRDFRLGPDADLVASVSQSVESFLADTDRVPNLPLRPLARRALLHGHCQQKAVFGTAGTIAALQRIPELRVEELDSGCCGMAGSFGYELGHYELSEALAHRVLIPAAMADPDALLIAPGFSCRSQVKGLAGLAAEHPVEVIAACLP